MLATLRRFAPAAISVFAALVFLDSLRFKFTDHPNTQEIFGRLDGWAGTLGLAGLFGHTGLFGQYVIGATELFASTLLLLGLLPRLRRLSAAGALVGLAVMSGAVSFHLFTPLGIDPNNNGGWLFRTAVLVWIAMLTLLALRSREVFNLLGDLGRAFVPEHASPSRVQLATAQN